MKTSVIALTALATVASAAEQCVYSTVSTQLHSLGTEIADCTTATGINVARPTEPFSAEQQSQICNKCTTLVDKVTPMTWPDCEMALGGKNQTLTAYFDGMVGKCKAGGATTTTSTENTATAGSSAGKTGSTTGNTTETGSSTGEVTAPTGGAPTPSPSSANIVTPLSVVVAAVVSVAAFAF
ncbi:hypothetical protein Poli38472_010967 [Pythium oligandrum]|uniref:Elicitin n=1 Tax=Pythium oligandrum TaxID=41045 RepID=A0A8K1FIB6_PYTOL|nr:hypothetical protein Poli38472_010967 [Pythium oligandrum]|eukprot:TMW61904.1 hypothetical protein Poli38472_010967 [Pythium oligandrum]